MATISSLGLSGLPLDDLLNNLRTNERQSLDLIQNRADRAQSRLSAYGQLKSALVAFQQAAQNIGKIDTFNAVQVSSTSDAFKAQATGQAMPGQHAVRVVQLASHQSVALPGVAERGTELGTGGRIHITLANGDTHDIDLDPDQPATLESVAAAINAQADTGIQATILNAGGDDPYQLLLGTRDTGTQAAISQISTEGNATLAALLDFDAAQPADGVIVQAAQDAEVEFNGVTLHSQSNTLENVIDGLTLTLVKPNATAETLSLTADNARVEKAIQAFVDGYNGLQRTVRQLSAYDTKTGQAQPLAGDVLARSVQTQMRRALDSAPGATELSLGALGITTDPSSGDLLVDQKKLSQAVSQNKAAIQDLFTASGGIAARLDGAIRAFVDDGGLISNSATSLDRQIVTIQAQYQQASARIDQRMETYRQQFVALDRMVTEMNSLSSYLSQQLEALGQINSSGK
ncbi:MAG: flagellar filament capping protein FliD [Burkholderiaceae bacterium]|uniref:flagellar filament capping protein FliD n=1 Tax=Castellaniella sp. TaxID=1955812 RepID=UPI00355CD1F9